MNSYKSGILLTALLFCLAPAMQNPNPARTTQEWDDWLLQLVGNVPIGELSALQSMFFTTTDNRTSSSSSLSTPRPRPAQRTTHQTSSDRFDIPAVDYTALCSVHLVKAYDNSTVRIGWQYIPQVDDFILVKAWFDEHSETIKSIFINPDNPNEELPKGLYYWRFSVRNIYWRSSVRNIRNFRLGQLRNGARRIVKKHPQDRKNYVLDPIHGYITTLAANQLLALNMYCAMNARPDQTDHTQSPHPEPTADPNSNQRQQRRASNSRQPGQRPPSTRPKSTNNQEENKCPVCLDQIQKGNIYLFPCTHKICKDCRNGMKQAYDNRCPVCRQNDVR